MFTRARHVLTGMALAALVSSPAFAEPSANTPLAPQAAAATSKPAPAKRGVTKTAARTTPAQPDTEIRSDSAQAIIWRQTGIASWYGGKRWQGKATASGVRYDQNKLTAAHATLPIGTKVRVTLEGSDRSVVVLINDRPGTRRRIIDLSRQAAAELGIVAQGLAVVTLTAL